MSPKRYPCSSSNSSSSSTNNTNNASSSSNSTKSTRSSSSKKQRKIVVAGSRAVGKSAVTIQFAEDRFVDNYNPTIESTFQKIIVYNNTSYAADIVDTAGQDEYTIFQPQYALGIDGYVLVYSIASRQSFDIIKVVNEKILNSTGNESVPRILVANKCDLGDNQRKVSKEEGEKLAKEMGVPFVECSAKMNDRIDEIFKKLLILIEGGNPDEQIKEKKPGCTIC